MIRDINSYITNIALVDDDPIYSQIIIQALSENSRYDISWFKSGEELENHLKDHPDIVIIDYNLPGMSGLTLLNKVKEFDPDIGVVMLSGQDKVDVVVDAFQQGANNYVIKNDSAIAQLKQCLKNLATSSNLRKEVQELRDQILDRGKYYKITGESMEVIKVLKLIQKVEKTDLITLITGESGTGKDVVAKTIHFNSKRKKKPFVPVNMAAIPSDLIESELFGHEKGAFTGATTRRIGKFEEANGGTIFLDEIGEMALDLQAKLLRVLQDYKISRLGSNKEIKLDIRIIAATNQNLAEQVKNNKFREDLYYRLQGFLIPLPPLRKRGNDIIILSKEFLSEFSEQNDLQPKKLSKQVVARLLSYNWPGNVRELKSVIERAALLSESPIIETEDLIFNPVHT